MSPARKTLRSVEKSESLNATDVIDVGPPRAALVMPGRNVSSICCHSADAAPSESRPSVFRMRGLSVLPLVVCTSIATPARHIPAVTAVSSHSVLPIEPLLLHVTKSISVSDPSWLPRYNSSAPLSSDPPAPPMSQAVAE